MKESLQFLNFTSFKTANLKIYDAIIEKCVH